MKSRFGDICGVWKPVLEVWVSADSRFGNICGRGNLSRQHCGVLAEGGKVPKGLNVGKVAKRSDGLWRVSCKNPLTSTFAVVENGANNVLQDFRHLGHV